ncbi:MAG: hypothetical protein C0410_15375 [Anaerolinea sp.]|nr:hypothetical protein [Anaerolinea sp.]
MKKSRVFIVLILMLVSLSCNLPFVPQISKTTVLSVSVTPPTGERDFSLSVKYSYEYHRGENSAAIHCTYTTPEGSVVVISIIAPTSKEFNYDEKTYSNTETIPFQVKSINGKIETGIYTASCSTQFTGSEVKTTFVVVDGSETKATSTLEKEEVVTATATLTVTPTQKKPNVNGQILFDFSNVDSTREGAGGELKRVTELCIPDIILNGEGTLTGYCEKLHIQALLTDESITTSVNGKVDDSGNLTFTYEVSEIGTPNGAWRITYEGQGDITSGTALFNFNCNSGADNLVWCWKWTSESFSGSLPWTFTANSQ